jgi:uncharacterized repeat protein (TIGR01451 family)
VTKTASTEPVRAAGDTVMYTIAVTNDGNLTLNAVAVNDPLCTSVLVSGDSTNPGVLDVGETWTYHCMYTVTQPDIDAGFINNTVRVSAVAVLGQVVNSEASAQVSIPGSAPLPKTGFSATEMAVRALLLIALGLGFVLASRRTRHPWWEDYI